VALLVESLIGFPTPRLRVLLPVPTQSPVSDVSAALAADPRLRARTILGGTGKVIPGATDGAAVIFVAVAE
jgi:hypothetical protein